jgi:penicillin G amidase
VKPRDLPRVINPKKGFIVTANNRQMPDNVNIDVGATITSTIRAQRITELIQKGIDANHKFDYNDMLTIQNDTVDLMARDIVPLVTKLGIEML